MLVQKRSLGQVIKAVFLTGLLLMILAVVNFTAPNQAAGQDIELAGLFTPAPEDSTAVAGLQSSSAAVRQRLVSVNYPLLGQADGRGHQPGQQLYLNLFTDLSYTADPTRVESVAPGKLAWSGQISEESGSSVTLSISDGALAGTIQVDGRLFILGEVVNGLTLLSEAGPGDPLPEYPPIPVVADVAEEESDSVPERDATSLLDGDDGSVIDVLVAYTPAARTKRGGAAGIQALIDLAVAETNQAYQNSQINTRLNLVLAAEVNYSESGDIITDLTRLQGKSDGYMDGVHGWRDSLKADLVSLISVDNSYCGIGYLMLAQSPGFDSFAFTVVNVDCAIGYYSFGHELGHNMGSAHDRANGSSSVTDYGFGYQASNRAFRTIMAYNCPYGCPRVQHFSNPNISYGGQPTGIDHNINPANSADNARSINDVRLTVANWRVSSPPLPDPPQAPTNLSASSISFHQIDLTWQNNASNADGIIIERQREGGGWVQTDQVPPTKSSFSDNLAAPDTSYSYRIRAFNLGGNSSYSNLVSDKTSLAPVSLYFPSIFLE